MKVTVCFNAVRVVVPCGEGNFSVRDLTSRAITRYRKATGKEQSDSWVTVHNLRQLDGGILDPDDRLNDVADDREQIIANFDESTQPHQGDGTSASDQSETSSPDIFKNANHTFEPFSCNGIEITDEELSATPPLHVRRGSEPALNRLSPIPSYNYVTPDPSKRWSAAPVIEDDIPSSSTPLKGKMNRSFVEDAQFYDDFPGERGEGSGEEKNPSATSSGSSHHSATTTTISRFSRDTNRCSVQILSDNPGMTRWAEAADRAANECYVLPDAKRREPVGGVATPTQSRQSSLVRSRPPSSNDCRRQLVVLPNDGSPLGIHVIPSTDKSGNDLGLLVEGIEQDGRMARDGNIQVHDVIIEINGQSLKNVSFHQAQEIFKDAMNAIDLRLLVIKRSELNYVENNELVESHKKTLSGVTKVANVTATRKIPTASLSSRTQSVILQSNTRKIGKKVTVNLVKGAHGLGFSITTRDNPAGGEAPIYIKNILPKGAAIEEGSLKIGDRLLEVNSIPVTGYNQSDVANLLRQIQIGNVAALVVSRQERPLTEIIVNFDHRSVDLDGHNERNPDSPKLPRQLVSTQASEKAAEDSLLLPWKQREILTFEIPIHDSERAGLGVSVKGKTSTGPAGKPVDLGIFVKNVIHGGAASKDGRLRQNDQLVNINAISLLGKSNSQAMNTLRTATYEEGPIPGMITLTIARRLDAARDSYGARSGRDSVNSLGTTSSGTETVTLGGTKCSFATSDLSGASDVSNSTVVYVRQNDQKMVGPDNSFSYEHKTYDGMPGNPVIQRITGGISNQALRNESYYRATHETWNSSQIQHFASQERECRTEERRRAQAGTEIASPTVNPPSKETVIIHDEYDVNENMNRYNTVPTQIHSTCGRMYSDQPSHCSDTYMSQSSLESTAGFSRDQVGRQSISEKRHATLDAKSTDTYQRSKKAREERSKINNNQDEAYSENASRNHTLLRRSPTPVVSSLQRASSEESLQMHETESKTLPRSQDSSGPKSDSHRIPKEIGPGLGMRKSSSLESLQTMVQEMTLEENGKRLGTGKVPRGRGCNESFRAAVDRSYDAPLSNASSQMETVNEEESESSGSGFGRNNSRQSSVNSSADDRKRHYRKKQGLLKGLGSMFRFGKHRRTPEPELSSNEILRKENYEKARRHHQEEQDRMQLKYRNMLESQQHVLHKQQMSSSSMAEEDSNTSRTERMHQLRAEHQRRHAERNRTYPTDDVEERYDHVMKQVNGATLDKGISASIITANTDVSQVTSSAGSYLIDNNSFDASKSRGHPDYITVDKRNCAISNSKTGVVYRKNRGRSICRPSLYAACLVPSRNSPSPPIPGSRGSYVQNPDFEDFNRLPTECHQEEELNCTSSASSIANKNIADGLRGLIIQKGVSHKPPLPPRNRFVNNNYKPPVPPPSNKSVYSTPHPNPKKFTANLNHNGYQNNLKIINDNNQKVINNNSLNDLIGPNFSFSFNKPLRPCPSNILTCQSESSTTLSEIEAQNFANHTQSEKLFYEPSAQLSFKSNHLDQNIPIYNGSDCKWNFACPSLSSGSSTTSSNCSVRSNSLPRMGLKGKTAAKLLRNSPSPAPVPPPKGLRNPLAPLRSTEVLDQCQFWRLEPVPPEPKAEILHIRSQSYDVYGSNRKRSGRAPFQDPNNYSHYVNYEQIQMHMRKNKEQERLTQLASQQYQDFRDKQTRRAFHPEEKENESKLLYKLEERFIHESVLASREQREYQSQRSSRDTSFQQRPVSNYFEYESVQAMMSHAQRNQVSSLPRRTHQNSPTPYSGHVSNTNTKNGNKMLQGPKDFPNKQSYGGINPASKPSHMGRDSIYAASGFRPASQYPFHYKTGPSFQPNCHPANSKV